MYKMNGLRNHLRRIHNYSPKQNELGTIESRYLECFHCDAKFHLADRDKLTVHLTVNHFKEIKLNWFRKSLLEPMYKIVDGLLRCKKCEKVVGKKEGKMNNYCKDYNHLNKVSIDNSRNSS